MPKIIKMKDSQKGIKSNDIKRITENEILKGIYIYIYYMF